jgi:hypothetical protein
MSNNTELTPEEIEDFLFKYDSDVYCEGAVYGESAYSYNLVKEILTAFSIKERAAGKAEAEEIDINMMGQYYLEFAEWLYQNRWFHFENGKWYYSFEAGTSVSDATYKKNYMKTTKLLFAEFMVMKLPSTPPKEQ